MATKNPLTPSKKDSERKRIKSGQTQTRAKSSLDSSLRNLEYKSTNVNFALKPSPAFEGLQLPSKKEVLERLFYLLDNDNPGMNRSLKSIVDQVLSEVVLIYEKVPMLLKENSANFQDDLIA